MLLNSEVVVHAYGALPGALLCPFSSALRWCGRAVQPAGGSRWSRGEKRRNAELGLALATFKAGPLHACMHPRSVAKLHASLSSACLHAPLLGGGRCWPLLLACKVVRGYKGASGCKGARHVQASLWSR